jgi:hypothetical protein
MFFQEFFYQAENNSMIIRPIGSFEDEVKALRDAAIKASTRRKTVKFIQVLSIFP